jgi:hypothetical protein
MTKALDQFIAEHRAPKSAITVAGDFECRDWVHTDEHGWNPCGVRRVSMWADCPNVENHGRPVLKRKAVDEIEPGDRIQFFHGASGRDQWATVLEWTAGHAFPDGKAAEWHAVLHIEHLDLGNGFNAGTKVQRHTIERYRAAGFKAGWTPGVFR